MMMMMMMVVVVVVVVVTAIVLSLRLYRAGRQDRGHIQFAPIQCGGWGSLGDPRDWQRVPIPRPQPRRALPSIALGGLDA